HDSNEHASAMGEEMIGRRRFVSGLGAAFACPLCIRSAGASDTGWDYTSGPNGPAHWSEHFSACGGQQQSPIDLTDNVAADLPPLTFAWKGARCKQVDNNGHTIVVTVEAGNTLVIGSRTYDLRQFHFHAPSEHTLPGVSGTAMEAHFVHVLGADPKIY